MPTPEIKFAAPGFHLHPRQAELVNCTSRFMVGACGRRFGKSKGLMYRKAKHACKAHKRNDVLYWWCAPTYARAAKAFDEFEKALRPVVKRASREDYSVTLLNGVRTEFVSLKEWQNRKGDGLDGVTIDEAARCPEAAWNELIYPALMDKQGWAAIISTPLGRNWFHREFMRGTEGSSTYNPQYKSFRFPMSDNPFIHPQEIEDARIRMPEDLFRQEILAEFLVEGAGVFLGLSGCSPNDYELVRGFGVLSPRFPPGIQATKSYLGVDLGKHQDFSVLFLIQLIPGVRPQVTYIDRFTQMDWKVQERRVVELAKKHRAKVVIDSSGAGDRVYEELRDQGCDVLPFKFSSPSNRQMLYRNLQTVISKGGICLPKEPELEIAWKELESFEYVLTPGGKLSVGPPDGEHDDCVASLALAVHGLLGDSSTGDISDFLPENQLKIIRNLASMPLEELNTMMERVNGDRQNSTSPWGGTICSPFSGTYFGGGGNGDYLD